MQDIPLASCGDVDQPAMHFLAANLCVAMTQNHVKIDMAILNGQYNNIRMYPNHMHMHLKYTQFMHMTCAHTWAFKVHTIQYVYMYGK